MGMSRALIGRSYPGGTPFTVTAEGALAYADATNAANPRYRGADPIAPPMLGVAFTFGALGAPLFDPGLQVEMMRLVHGEQDMRFLAPVRPGDTITSESVIVDIVQKTSGELLVIDIAAHNQRNERVLEARSGLFVRGPRQRDNLEAERAERAAAEAQFATAPHAWTHEETVAPDQSTRYAEASGDRNPIHLDIEVARMAGLPAIILHGLCTMAFVHNACVDAAGGDPMRVRRLSVRFNRPVLMGDVLAIEARGPAGGPWQIRVTNQSRVAVLTHGVAELA